MKYLSTFTLFLSLSLLIGFSAGCAAFQAFEGVSAASQTQVNQVKAKVSDIDLALAKLKAYVDTLPAGSADRRLQEQLIDKLEQGKAVQEAWIKAQESGDTSDLAKLIQEIPYVGGWGGFAVTLLGFFAQKRKNSLLISQAQQIVDSVDKAFPNKSETQKAALDAVQDTDTKALVAQLRGEL